jgi:GH15 family glucan-1,4-alpha-glucosidase
VGGDLNWDYRYCWLRDASLTVRVLFDLGYVDEAEAFVSWLLHATRLKRPELKILYDVYGELPGKEVLIDELDGHRASRPVRIRNAAASQLQLDAYGEVIDAVARIAHSGRELDGSTQAMLGELGEFVCNSWWRADQGIWEPRGPAREHTHSRLLCWVAVDRLLELHQKWALKRVDGGRLREVRERIHREIQMRAWNPTLRSYTQTLGGKTVDASLMLMGWYGYAPQGDARLEQTVECIRERLDAGRGLLYRYEESAEAGEGAFGLCCFWAAEHLARGGASYDDARAYLEQLFPFANDLGLLQGSPRSAPA